MEFNERQMESLMVAGLWCCQSDPSFRPSIKQVVNILNFEAPLPNLRPKLPKPMYFAHSLNMDSTSYTTSTDTTTTRDQFQYTSSSSYTDSSTSAGLSRPTHKILVTVRRGLDTSVLQSIPVLVFQPEDFKDGLECAVCLSDLAQGEKARLLPKCNHGFLFIGDRSRLDPN
ncbi:hypothetical protein G4B88_005910 [Cannabis sativa]|uniref:RING-type E3 ubiquitin transferase n=1 Tax=Cannabis sativa TaxID=3483 RepID=A0A7J6IAA7_CANSA|nr:hypothetical protein G4B88_005910 [Cannabis sativa]